MSESTEAEKMKVLLVDDEVEFLEDAAKALRRRGFEVHTAENGMVALMCLGKVAIDVVVLDVKMPWLDGVEVFRAIRKDWPDLPVIMLTGHGNVQQAFQTSKEGVFDYLAKPIDLDDLAQVLRRAVETSSATRPAARSVDTTDVIRVLLVDDEQELLDSLAPVLRRRSMTVSTATSGETALEVMKRERFDVAVVDVKMPGIDGIVLLGRLKVLYPDTEIIILTGHPSTQKAVKAIWAGAFDYLTKPIDSDELVARIREASRNRQVHVERQRENLVEAVLSKRPVD